MKTLSKRATAARGAGVLVRPLTMGRADLTTQVRKGCVWREKGRAFARVPPRPGQNAPVLVVLFHNAVAAVEQRSGYRTIQTTVPQTMMLMGHANITPFSNDDRQRRGRVRARSIGPARGDASIMAALVEVTAGQYPI